MSIIFSILRFFLMLVYATCGLQALRTSGLAAKVTGAGAVLYALAGTVYATGAVVVGLVSWWGLAAIVPATLIAWGARMCVARAGLPADSLEP